MKLYICEKPSQARDLARNLAISGKADGFITNNSNSHSNSNSNSHSNSNANTIAITWAIGHLLQQLEPNEIDPKYAQWSMEQLPIVPELWKLRPNAKTKKQLNVIKGLLKQSSHVVIATDGDREGELIGRELLEYFNWSGHIDRLWLTALDDSSIQKALNNLKSGIETQPLYAAGLARQRADWIVGMNATRALSIQAQKTGNRGVLSVGRVQTPTLGIVVNRDLEIESFKSQDYYDVVGVFSGVQAKWNPRCKYSQEFMFAARVIFDSELRCIDYEYASENIAKKCSGYGTAKVIKFATQHKKVPPPLLYSLSALQQTANKKFGFSAKQVLDLAQALYEKHKATTYPRSDCQYLPISQLSEASDVMSAISSIDSAMGKLIANADLTIISKVYNDKKLGAHHGIIPTSNMQVDITKISADELKIYTLICKSYIAQFYPDYEYDKTSIEISASDESFISSINKDVNLGWRVVVDSQTKLKPAQSNQTELEPTQSQPTKPKQSPVPNLAHGQELTIDSIDVQTKQTKPLPRYTEGSLICAMEKAHLFVKDPNLKKVLKGNEGIGTQATRASIIDLLKKRNFLIIKNKQIISSATGRALISAVPSAIKDPGMTAIMESSLSKIETSELSLDAFINWQVDWLAKLIETIKASSISIGSNTKTIKCCDCGKDMLLRQGNKAQFWGCSGYPACKTTAQNHNGKAWFEKDMPKCPNCGKSLRRVKGKKGFFWSCKGYFDTPKCEFTTSDKQAKPVFK